MTPNTDAPDAADNDYYYPYSLRNRNKNKNNMTPNTDSPNYDFHYADDDDAAPPHPLLLS